MKTGDRVVAISGFWHGRHGVITEVLPDGNLRFQFETEVWNWNACPGKVTVTVKPFDIELEEREDLWIHLI